jgi:hypothetical protein
MRVRERQKPATPPKTEVDRDGLFDAVVCELNPTRAHLLASHDHHLTDPSHERAAPQRDAARSFVAAAAPSSVRSRSRCLVGGL